MDLNILSGMDGVKPLTPSAMYAAAKASELDDGKVWLVFINRDRSTMGTGFLYAKDIFLFREKNHELTLAAEIRKQYPSNVYIATKQVAERLNTELRMARIGIKPV